MRPLIPPPAIHAALFLLQLWPALTSVAQQAKPPQNGVWRVFHPIGKILTLEEHYKDGLRHGPSQQFDKSGLIREANYVDGKLDGFWRQYEQGNLVEESNYKDGKRDGATLARLKDYKMDGQYLNDKPDGVWTEERPGRWSFVKRYKEGLPHGIWERKNKDGREDLRLTYDEGKLVSKPAELRNLPYLQKVAADAANGKDPLADRLLRFLEHDVDLDYRQIPLAEVIDDLKDRFNVPIYMDLQIADVPRLMETPITIEQKKVQVFLGLHDLVVDHGLTFDYRFHSFWLTTPKALAAWKDTTGVSDLKPFEGSPLAKALPELSKFDLLATPFAQLAEVMRKEQGIEVDASRVTAAKWRTHESSRLRQLLKDALFISLYENGCRCREKGGKLIIEPLEKQP